MASGIEFELKLSLTPEEVERVARRRPFRPITQGRMRSRTLFSVYHDTADFRLADAGMAVRVRDTGSGWRMTAKMDRDRAATANSFMEHEVDLPGPDLDLALLPEEARDRLVAALGGADLVPVFETRFTRRTWTLEPRPGATVELALDSGAVTAGGRSAAIAEAELELLTGDPDAVFAAARTLAGTVPIRASTVTKAARGYHLAGDTPIPAPEPAEAERVAVTPETTTEDALRAGLRSVYRQIAANIIAVETGDDPEGVHQIRVALRRFRSMVRFFGGVLPLERVRALDAAAAALARSFGPARDLDVLALELFPPVGAGVVDGDLVALSAAIDAARGVARAEARALALSPAMGAFLLDLGAFVEGAGWRDPASAEQPGHLISALRDHAATALGARWRRVSKHMRHIDRATIAERHEARLALKKLRYACDLAAGGFPRKRTKGFLRDLKALQDLFGNLNDAATVGRLGRELAAKDPQLAHAAGILEGWHAHAAEATFPRAARCWKALKNDGPFW